MDFLHACVWERVQSARVRRERLIGVLVLCRGRDAREAEIISLVELNLNGAAVRDPQFFSFILGAEVN